MRKWLIKKRLEAGLSQVRLSELIGVHQTYYSDIERGTRMADMPLSMIAKLAEVFSMDANTVVSLELAEQEKQLRELCVAKVPNAGIAKAIRADVRDDVYAPSAMEAKTACEILDELYRNIINISCPDISKRYKMALLGALDISDDNSLLKYAHEMALRENFISSTDYLSLEKIHCCKDRCILENSQEEALSGNYLCQLQNKAHPLTKHTATLLPDNQQDCSSEDSLTSKACREKTI